MSASASAISDYLSFGLPVGQRIGLGSVRGYYIDFRAKTESPAWPPPDQLPMEDQLFVVMAQWGLGAYEHYLHERDASWLSAAEAVCEYLVGVQTQDGARAGAWIHRASLRHTFDVGPNWISAMAQGEGASLLVRVHLETGKQAYADAARLALRPVDIPTVQGGAMAPLDDGFIPEEYPTSPPSMVLNGAIFALWGYYDVATALGDDRARARFDLGVATLAQNLWRWDTGHWSRYDLHPHPIKNLATPAYHELHANQLRAMQFVAPREEFAVTAERFARYASSHLRVAWAVAHKVFFRMLVPGAGLAGRLPRLRRRRA